MRSKLKRRIGLAVGATCLPLLLIEILVRLYYFTSGTPLHIPFGAHEESYLAAWAEDYQQRSQTDDPSLVYGMGQYDRRLGWTPKPNLSKVVLENRPPVSTNAKGLRTLREIPYSKPAGKRRLVAIGDSYTFGMDGEDQEIWPVLLEESLDQWEVVNLGVFAYGIDQQLIMLQEEGLKYSPDIVVVGFYEDDATRAMLAFRDFAKPRFQVVNDRLVLTNVPVPSPEEILSRYQHRDPPSYAWHWLQQRLRRRGAFGQMSSTEYSSERSALSRAILRQMQQEVSNCGAKMLVVFIPEDIYRESEKFVLRDELATWSTKLGYAFLDLQPILKTFAKQEMRSPLSGHFNPLGNVIATQAIREKLTELNWVDPPTAAAVASLEEHRELAMSGALTGTRALYSQARMLQTQGHQAQAESLYREMLRLDPESPKGHFGLSNALTERGQHEEAANHLREALRIVPAWPQAHGNLGAVLAEKGDTQEAVTHLREALRLLPDYLRAHINLASVLAREGQYQDAISHLLQAVQLDPDSPAVHYDLGCFLERLGQYEEAFVHFQEVLKLKPVDALAHNKMGRHLATRGNTEDAISHFREAIRLDPGFAEAMNNLARIHAAHPKAGFRNPSEAVRLAEQACELTARKNSACLGTLAAAYAESGRFDESVSTVKIAIELAQSVGHKPLVSMLRTQLALYQQHRPYRDVLLPSGS